MAALDFCCFVLVLSYFESVKQFLLYLGNALKIALCFILGKVVAITTGAGKTFKGILNHLVKF